MSVGEVASLIAALAFLLLVVFLAIPLWKLGKVFDQLQGSIKQVLAIPLGKFPKQFGMPMPSWCG